MMAQQAFSFNLVGMEQLMKNLEQLPTIAMKKTVVRNACKKSLIPVRDLARQNAPYDPRVTKGFSKSRHLRDTIEVSTSLKASQKRKFAPDRTKVTVYVGSTAPHAHLIEFGTKERTPKEPFTAEIRPGQVITVKSMGRAPAIPFLRNAWDAAKDRIISIFAKEMKVELEKAAARLAKRAATGKLTKAQIRGLR